MRTRNFISVVAVVLLSAGFMNAQGIKVTYQESIDLEQQLQDLDPALRTTVKQQMQERGRQPAILYQSNGASLYVQIGEQSIYKNMGERQKISQESILGKEFVVTDSLKAFDWKLESEQKEILGYQCRKAVLPDSKATAWYCPDIPINDGPGIYWGLPGIILSVEIGAMTITAVEINLKEAEAASWITIPDKGKKLTRKEFEELRDKKMKSLSTGDNVRMIKF